MIGMDVILIFISATRSKSKCLSRKMIEFGIAEQGAMEPYVVRVRSTLDGSRFNGMVQMISLDMSPKTWRCSIRLRLLIHSMTIE
jgi:hypothetical protein